MEQADALHDALDAAERDVVAAHEGLGGEDGHAGEEVRGDALHGKGQSQACNREDSHQRGGVDAEVAGHDDYGYGPQGDLDGAGDEVLEALFHLAALKELLDERGNDLDDDQADDEDDHGGQDAGDGEIAELDSLHAVEKVHAGDLLISI